MDPQHSPPQHPQHPQHPTHEQHQNQHQTHQQQQQQQHQQQHQQHAQQHEHELELELEVGLEHARRVVSTSGSAGLPTTAITSPGALGAGSGDADADADGVDDVAAAVADDDGDGDGGGRHGDGVGRADGGDRPAEPLLPVVMASNAVVLDGDRDTDSDTDDADEDADIADDDTDGPQLNHVTADMVGFGYNYSSFHSYSDYTPACSFCSSCCCCDNTVSPDPRSHHLNTNNNDHHYSCNCIEHMQQCRQLNTKTDARRRPPDVDIQGICWRRFKPTTRDSFRKSRMLNYRNYKGLGNISHDSILHDIHRPRTDGSFYSFFFTKPNYHYKPAYYHFQLRYLLWCPSKNDVFYAHGGSGTLHLPISLSESSPVQLRHWCPISRKSKQIIDLETMQLSTISANRGFVFAGSTNGLYAYKRVSHASSVYYQTPHNLDDEEYDYHDHGHDDHVLDSRRCGESSGSRTTKKQTRSIRSQKQQQQSNVSTDVVRGMITDDVHGITNHAEIVESRFGETLCYISSNDNAVRVLNMNRSDIVSHFHFDWPVNCATVSPDKRMLCVSGDHEDSLIVSSDSGDTLFHLKGHLDHSFSSDWSPCGRYIATGNQDNTVRLFDIRYPSKSLVTLSSIVSAFRSVRFSDDGVHLAAAEAADFVHIFDIRGGLSRHQQEHASYHPAPPSSSLSSSKTSIVSLPSQKTPSESSLQHRSYHTTPQAFALTEHEYRCQIIDFFGEISGIAFSPWGGDALYIGNADEKYGCILEFQKCRYSPNPSLTGFY